MHVQHQGYSVAQISEILHCSQHTVREHIACGNLSAVNIATTSVRPRWLIFEQHLQDFIERRSTISPSSSPENGGESNG